MEIKKRAGEKGQALVEFALMLTVLLTFIFVIVEAGRIFQAWVTVQNSARSAARYALTGQYNDNGVFETPECPPGTPPSEYQVCSVKDEALRTAAGLNIDPSAGPLDPRAFGSQVLYAIEIPGPITGTTIISFTEGVARPGDPTRVRVYYNVEVITPFFRVFADNIRVQGQVEVVTEDYDQITPGDIASSTVSDNPPSPPLPTEADIIVNKRGPTGLVYVDDIITYHIDVLNTGDSGVPKVTVVDMLPSETTTVTNWTVTSGGNTVDQATCVVDTGPWEIDCVIPYLDSGQLATVNVDLILSPLVFNDEVTKENVYVTNTVEVFNQTKTIDPDLTNNESYTTTQVKPWADMELLKTGFPSNVAIGEELTYEILVANAGPNTGQDSIITDDLPDKVKVTGLSLANGSCDPYDPDELGPIIRCVLDPMGPGAQTTLYITATAIKKGNNISNTASVSDSNREVNMATLINGNPDDQSDSTSTTVFAPVLEISKVGPGAVETGALITFTVTATNTGNYTATNIIFTDTLSFGPDLTYGAWTASSPCSSPISSNPFTCQLVSLAVGDSVSFSLVFTTALNVDTTKSWVQNFIEIASNNDLVTGTAEAIVDINRTFNLDIEKEAPNIIYAGETITYLLNLTNNGPSSTDSIVISDRFTTTIPLDDLTLIPLDCDNFVTDTDGYGFSCTISPLQSNHSHQFKLASITAATDGEIDNTATVTDTYGVKSDLASTTVLPVADLSLSSGSFTSSTGTLTYTLDLENIGPSAAENVTVTNIATATGWYASAAIYNDGVICDSSPAAAQFVLTCLISSTLSSGSSEPVILVFSYYTKPNSIDNHIEVNSETFDPIPDNNFQDRNFDAGDLSFSSLFLMDAKDVIDLSVSDRKDWHRLIA